MTRPKVLAAGAAVAGALVALVLVLLDATDLVLVLLVALAAATLAWSVVGGRGNRLEQQVGMLDARQAAALEALRREVAELRDATRGPDER